MSTKDKKPGRVGMTPERRVQYDRDRAVAKYYRDLSHRRRNFMQWLLDHDEDDSWRQYQVQEHLADGTSGSLELLHYTVPRISQARMAYMLEMGEDRDCGSGRFIKLIDNSRDPDHEDGNGNLWMSDTRAEIMELMPLVNRFAKLQSVQAGPTVLITGLGLGMAVRAALLHGASQVDVVELDPNVINLSGKQFLHDPVHIWQGNALTAEFPSGRRWDVAWHDIWPTINDDNLVEMAALRARYKATWTGCWQEAGCRWMDRILKKKQEYEAIMGPIDAQIAEGEGYLDPVLDRLIAEAEARQ